VSRAGETMQWGHPQPRSGEGDEAMLRSGAMIPAATMQSVTTRRSGANEH
jgi:hypothetical protein